MAKKEYKHAYKRENKIWVKGTFEGFPFKRIAANKHYSVANMNWVEKNWETLFLEHYTLKGNLKKEKVMLTIKEFIPVSLKLSSVGTTGSTSIDYGHILNKHVIPTFGALKINAVTRSLIKDWQTDLMLFAKCSLKTIKNIRSAFSGVFENAIEKEYIVDNPILQVKAPKSHLFISMDEDGKECDLKGRPLKIELEPFSLDEMLTLIETADVEFQTILTVLFFTGMRIQEMVALKWEDIDFEEEEIYIQRANKSNGKLGLPKNHSKRKVTLLKIVERALQKHMMLTNRKVGFIFLQPNGKRYTNYKSLRHDQWYPLLEKCSFEQRKLFQTRHSFASLMISNNEDIAWISLIMLGHSEISTTLKFYAKYINNKKLKRAVFLELVELKRTNNVQSILEAA